MSVLSGLADLVSSFSSLRAPMRHSGSSQGAAPSSTKPRKGIQREREGGGKIQYQAMQPCSHAAKRIGLISAEFLPDLTISTSSASPMSMTRELAEPLHMPVA